ncbi:hypothetical protein MHTCC0001_01320 [Flavobacteriaceae bacterium MHTCC 0001]
MSFLKRLFGAHDNNNIPNRQVSINPEIKTFLEDFVNEALEKKEGYSAKLANLDNYKLLKSKSEDFKKEIIHLLLHYKSIGYKGHYNKWSSESYYLDDIYSKLSSLLIRASDIEFNEEELLVLTKVLLTEKKSFFHVSQWPFMPLLSRYEKKIEKNGLTEHLKKGLSSITHRISNLPYDYADEKKIINRVKSITEGPKEFSVSNKDVLGRQIIETTKELRKPKREAYIDLLNHFSKHPEKSKPTNAWLKDAKSKMEDIGATFLAPSFISWIDVVIGLFQQIHREKAERLDFLTEENIQLLRSAVWGSSILNDDALNQKVEDLGLWSFKKLRGYGALSVKLGNGCIYAFSKLPYQDGVSRLTKFRMKIKYPSVQSLITKAIVRVAEAEGKTMDEIEELAVQDFDLNDDFQVVQNFGNYKGVITIVDTNTVSLLWENEKGKQIKTIPKYVKEHFSEDLKTFRKKVKDIQTNLSAQKSRIEKIFLSRRVWTYEQWKKLYLDNNLLGFFGKRLIWNFKVEDKTQNAIFHNGTFVNPSGALQIDFQNVEVSLWHPVNASVNEVQEWRNWLLSEEVTQPFKQAHREVYIVTDAEITTNSYSNRYAAHIIRQHIFNALCRERGWAYQLKGQWDSYNTPTFQIPSWKYKVEFWVETDAVQDSANEMGIFNYLQTDQVRFYNEDGQINMADVPKIVFSESMRDVDLFVAVTSIGADPNWRDRGEERFHGYWSNFSFGELAVSGKERKALLENIIPKLQIRKQCSFEGNFLVVEGKMRTYKIHMGSGNILMKPNDQYLCIVPDRRKEQNVFLPFEGDSTLSTILSKAFMLANDDKIKDITITSQIKGSR